MKAPVRNDVFLAVVGCSLLSFVQEFPSFAGGQYVAYDLGYGRAYDINSAGTVTGASTSSGTQRAFSFNAGAITDLGVLPGLDSSIGYAINEAENVVGVSFSSDGSGGFPQGFRFKIDTMADIGTLGFATYAYDINDLGIIVGESVVDAPGFPPRAFAAFGGTLVDLGTLGGSSSGASGVNNAGTIVGWAETANADTHAFSYGDGVMMDLGTLEVGGNSHASAINELGVIVGRASLGRHHRGFVYSRGRMTALGTLGGANSVANAINLEGLIVGSANTSNGQTHAFAYQDGAMADLAPYLAPLGLSKFNEALGVNDHGDIVGSGEDKSGRQHAFLLLFLSDHGLRRCWHRPGSTTYDSCEDVGGRFDGLHRRSAPAGPKNRSRS